MATDGLMPVVFRRSGEGAVASYDWVDISSGAGYTNYYLCADQTAYTLTTSQVYSDTLNSQSIELTNSYVKVFDDVFTTTLNLPKTVNGDVLVNIAGNAHGAEACDRYFIVKVIKISGVTETTLATGTSTTKSNTAGADSAASAIALLSIPVTNQLIKKGEEIGIRLEGYAKDGGASTPNYLYIGLDPKNRAIGSWSTSQSTVAIPFRIDL